MTAITVSISDFRENIKQYLEDVDKGKIILLSKRGKVIARITPESVINEAEEKAYQKRLKSYKNGGITINDDIIDQPLKEYDFLDDSIYSTPSVAAEPDA